MRIDAGPVARARRGPVANRRVDRRCASTADRREARGGVASHPASAAATPLRVAAATMSAARRLRHRLAGEPHQARVAVDRTEAFAARDQLALQAGHHRLGPDVGAGAHRQAGRFVRRPHPGRPPPGRPSGAPAGLRPARRRGSASARRTDRPRGSDASPAGRKLAGGARLEHLRLDVGTRRRRPRGQAFGAGAGRAGRDGAGDDDQGRDQKLLRVHNNVLLHKRGPASSGRRGIRATPE